MLVLRVAELVLITVITVLLIRAPGKKIHTSICLDWWTQSVSLQLKCYSVLYFPGNRRAPDDDTVSWRFVVRFLNIIWESGALFRLDLCFALHRCIMMKTSSQWAMTMLMAPLPLSSPVNNVDFNSEQIRKWEKKNPGRTIFNCFFPHNYLDKISVIAVEGVSLTEVFTMFCTFCSVGLNSFLNSVKKI